MPARFLLLLILLIHPVRGVLAAEVERRAAPADSCGSLCCPLCAELDSCPCSAAPDDPTPLPEPAAPIDTKKTTIAVPSHAPAVFSATPVTDASPRAPPACSLRSMDSGVGMFLSRVCVWTT